jgi:two-component system chemotaxis response regulator CheY
MSPLILIADDDDFIREVLREMLSRFDIVEAENGAKAVELYRKDRPQMVLMDILMPEMDGIEATRRIMGMDHNAIVLGVSAFAAVKGDDMLKAGAKEVLSKPVKMSDLLNKVQRYLDSKAKS